MVWVGSYDAVDVADIAVLHAYDVVVCGVILLLHLNCIFAGCTDALGL